MLARRLVSGLMTDRSQGWLPLRLALSRYPGSARDFLRQRLEEFKADVGGWKELSRTSKVLVILDGFDEISVELDPVTVTRNIKALLDCAREFEGCKMLITSRTHFFQNREDAQRLLERLGQPPTYHLAPISREEVLAHLSAGVSDVTRRQVLDRIQSMSDPIGLASKPLFLEMLKQVIASPDLPRDLDIVSLYERYIEQSLARKQELLDDPRLRTHPEETISNMRGILGEIAEELQRTGEGYLGLSKYQSSQRKPFAELLWKLSGEDEPDSDDIESDARARVGTRSLLARVQRQDIEEEWPVDFCHRSMREYFVSARLCEAVEEGVEPGIKFLREVPLNHEILAFAVERWRKSNSHISSRLLEIVARSTPSESPGRAGGYALTILHRLEGGLPKDFDWTGRVFDGADMEEADFSGMDFRGCSFRHANLANVNFENSNFEQADLTGVRIEETAYVVSLAFDPSGEKFIAAYGDNLLRHWRVHPFGRVDSRVVGEVRVEPSSSLGIHESGQRWMRVGRDWIFFDLELDQAWKELARFTIKEEIAELLPQRDLITLVESQGAGILQVTLVDLAKQIKLASLQASAARHCAALGTDALVWTGADIGVMIQSTARGASKKELRLGCTEPTCLSVVTAGKNEHLLAAGTSDGWIHLWELDLGNQKWAERKIVEVKAHEGPVTSLAFQNAKRLASGGADRSIALINFDGAGGVSGAVERRLVLTVRCQGMQTEGLRTETERMKLTKLILECTTPPLRVG
ncbi:MAG TPA: pentapeptide repeat-containing protein [Blastocatellia bacterium]|nr:pentapeptide repeat-containing protein [Blastocatellia bacterium]